jgi:L,D-transpeptidase YbiS
MWRACVMLSRLVDGLLHVVYSVLALLRRRFVVVDVVSQRLYVVSYGVAVASYAISTATMGSGERAGSYQTPRGWFRVNERYGRDADLDAVFVGRKIKGRLLDYTDSKDPILARILRLSGRQLGNANTFSRYVYIHGTTAQRMAQGQPASQGCVNMACEDVADLFADTELGLWVYIVDAANPLWIQPSFFKQASALAGVSS